MAKLNVPKSQSVSSSIFRHSGGKHSNSEPNQKRTQSLHASAKSFVPQMSAREKGSVQDHVNPGAKPKDKVAQPRVFSQPHPVKHQQSRGQTVEQRARGNVLNSHVESNNEGQSNNEHHEKAK